MKSINRPSKEQIREWLANRMQGHTPLPDTKQIRRELGWGYSRSACQCPIQKTT